MGVHNPRGILGAAMWVCMAAGTPPAAAEGEKYDPEYEHYVAPFYPPYLRDKGISGCVKLSYIVQREGSVSDIHVLKATHPRFANAATFAVARWRFKPWEVSEQKPASVQWTVNMHFTIDKERGCP